MLSTAGRGISKPGYRHLARTTLRAIRPKTSDAILKLPEVETLSGLKRSAIYERMALGAFPRFFPLAGRAVGWLESEVQQWISYVAGTRSSRV